MISGSPSRLERLRQERFGVYSKSIQCGMVLLFLPAGFGQKRFCSSSV